MLEKEILFSLNISSVYNICFLLEDGTPITIFLCVDDDCRGRFIYLEIDCYSKLANFSRTMEDFLTQVVA